MHTTAVAAMVTGQTSQTRIWRAGKQKLRYLVKNYPLLDSSAFSRMGWGVEEMTNSTWEAKTLGKNTWTWSFQSPNWQSWLDFCYTYMAHNNYRTRLSFHLLFILQGPLANVDLAFYDLKTKTTYPTKLSFWQPKRKLVQSILLYWSIGVGL